MQINENAKRIILLIEDQEPIQCLVVSHLTQQGYEVFAVSTGAEALEWLSTSRVDVILTDETLPDGDSIVLIQQIRTLFENDTPVIIWLNAHPSHVARVQELRGITDGAITKPFNPMELTAYLIRLFS